ncbi:hypothetical protein CRE_23558 [Caenorhabditis remanei]|uniref:DNA-directed DNA polymerase n=1 Tax=Caenorhabditis remanei TaxID=31234 RepID=E3MVT2_CAERE|nr:hypothetical protein CRE_23558 [Caenorhabditis remanei]
MLNMIVAHMFCNKCREKPGCPTCKESIIFSYKIDEEEGDDDRQFAGEEEESESGSECDLDEYEPEDRSKTLTKFCKFLMTDPRANVVYVIAHNGGRYDHVMGMAEMDRLAKPPNFIMNGRTFIRYCPYLYNHPDNYDKVLTTLPPKEYYIPDCRQIRRI